MATKAPAATEEPVLTSVQLQNYKIHVADGRTIEVAAERHNLPHT